jgi:hypothetical protein
VPHPYELGREDYMDGKVRSENRFAAGTDDYLEWERGWLYQLDCDPLIDSDEREAARH